jgi:hypothetical protein
LEKVSELEERTGSLFDLLREVLKNNSDRYRIKVLTKVFGQAIMKYLWKNHRKKKARARTVLRSGNFQGVLLLGFQKKKARARTVLRSGNFQGVLLWAF